jgi:hypothetical protein
VCISKLLSNHKFYVAFRRQVAYHCVEEQQTECRNDIKLRKLCISFLNICLISIYSIYIVLYIFMLILIVLYFYLVFKVSNLYSGTIPYYLYFIFYYISCLQIKKTEMGRTRNTYGGDKKCIQSVSGEI